MFLHFTGILLLLAQHTAGSQGDSGLLHNLAQISASPGETRNITCDIPDGVDVWKISWYKEEQDRSLSKIKESYEDRMEAYKASKAILILRNMQRKDAGIYYCATNINAEFKILNGTRLIIRDGSKPSVSILAPFSLEGSQLDHRIPLLCLFYDANPDWDTVSWDISGETFEDQKDGDMINGEGVFSIWSLRLVPPESWTEEMSYSCSNTVNGNVSAVFPLSKVPITTENCLPILYVGLPCIASLLLISALVLLFRKHFAKGNAEKPDTQIPIGEIQQTDYAEVRRKN